LWLPEWLGGRELSTAFLQRKIGPFMAIMAIMAIIAMKERLHA